MSANSIEYIRREVRNMLERISDLQIHADDLLAIIQDEMKQLNQTSATINIAWIDCCDECVWSAKRQLQPIDRVGFAGYLLNEVASTPSRLWDSFDLIITTTNHYQLPLPDAPQLSGTAPAGYNGSFKGFCYQHSPDTGRKPCVNFVPEPNLQRHYA